MKALVFPAVAATLAIFVTPALAQQHSFGTVASVDLPTLLLELDDGSTYRLENARYMSALRPGEKVVVTWDYKGDARAATDVGPDRRYKDERTTN